MKVTIFGKKTIVKEYTSRRLISDILKDVGLSPIMPCGGNHSCGKCLVKVSGEVSKITEQEKELLYNAPEGFRLSCFTYAEGDCQIMPNDNLDALVEAEGVLPQFPFNEDEGIGFAVDIGTTTIAVYAYDLRLCKLICKEGILNPQAAYGADVISRIDAAINGKSQALSGLIVKALCESFNKICLDKGIKKESVTKAVITGNTTMLYLLLNIDVKCLSAAPFLIENYLGIKMDAEEIGISDFKNLEVYFPKTIDAFIGSDITCSLLACDSLMKEQKVSVMIDIGTNGEMAMRNNEKLFCCSTAAGPAFEGAGIKMGSMAQSGAINKVYLENGKIKYTTVNNEPAISICGSGLIDAIAVFLDLKIIDESGYIDPLDEKYNDLITINEDFSAIKIPNSNVYITQNDIRALQLAKSAICAGIYSLIDACGLKESDIQKLFLAGGFGSYINPQNAAKIGLIPKTLSNKTKPLGNAAGMGASAILLSNTAKEHSIKTAENAKALNLSTSDYFMEKYIEGMLF